jgi:hypothetical protein
MEEYYLREISHGSRNYYPVFSEEELIKNLLNGFIDAGFVDNGFAEYTTGELYCNLTIAGAPFEPSAFGIVIPKGWIYGEELDVNILLLNEWSILSDLKTQWFPTNNCPDASSTSLSMGVDTMSGLLLVFAVISVLSWFLFAWQKRSEIKDYLVAHGCLKTSLINESISKANQSKKQHKSLENPEVTFRGMRRMVSRENARY